MSLVTAETTKVDPYAVPESYEAFFKSYWGYVVGLVRKMGIDDQNKEDVASAILLRFYERDFLKEYDPNFQIEHRGQKYRARFQSLLNSFVITYVQHHRDRQTLSAQREPISCDYPVGDGSSTWGEVFGPSIEDDYSDLEFTELTCQIRAHLLTVPRRSSRDVCDLPALFEQILKQAQESGRLDVKLLTQHFGVSSTAIHSWIQILRREIGVVLLARVA